MRSLPFTKMHGAGNDFVVLDGLRHELPPLEPLAARLAHRNFGVGFDQLLVVRPSTHDGADFRMEIYNADGSQVEMCANGIRCFYRYLREAGHSDADSLRVETLSGVVVPRWAGEGRVTVDMGPPVLAPAKVPTTLRGRIDDAPALDQPLPGEGLELEGGPIRVSAISMGNPHAVIFVPDVDAAPVARLGPRVEHHPAFPNRVNVEFVEVVGRQRVRQRTWERGTGETLACGSGACATAVASILLGLVDEAVTVELRGGELEIRWPGGASAQAGGGSESVWMTGPTATVFRGEIPLEED